MLGTENMVAPTVEHAKTLENIYSRLYRAVAASRKAATALKAAWSKGLDIVAEARDERSKVQSTLDQIMDQSWDALSLLPKGTTAPGGATPQTVALEFFSSNLNRDLKARLTSSQARQINGRSFAV